MKQNNQTTESAKDFAFVTHAARDMAEIMQRTFKVRIKGSSDLSFTLCYKKPNALVMGKWVNVRIDWEHTDKHCLVMQGDNDVVIILLEKEFHHMTRVGDFPKIAELYKLYKKSITG